MVTLGNLSVAKLSITSSSFDNLLEIFSVVLGFNSTNLLILGKGSWLKANATNYLIHYLCSLLVHTFCDNFAYADAGLKRVPLLFDTCKFYKFKSPCTTLAV